ncbi:MAG: ATP-binding protein, partial [Oscillospiraceae bacterium]|nr:ATP-binding protein [Oscillospiraceae bacterium]
KPAQNVLLYGDRGTGKSSTVKAILNESKYLRMVEVSKNDIDVLPKLFNKLKDIPLHFIVMIDDLSFAENDDRFGILKAALEGSLSAKPDNILIYATTNRRKIIRETAADREISGADAIDESMSLSDRFGLFVTFTKPDKRVYLDIVKQLAEDKGLDIREEELFEAAERFALKRGGRSPRTAKQFIDNVRCVVDDD